MDKYIYAGVELGGTKCICTIASGPDHIIAQEHLPTLHPDVTLTAIYNILKQWKLEYDFAALGIASFGPLQLKESDDGYGHIRRTNKEGWSGADILGLLSQQLDVPVGIDTDVNGAALAEMKWGAGHGMSDFAYVTVGTGIGAGLMVNGKSTKGISHGELGHLFVRRLPGDEFDGICSFHKDCVEGLASGEAIKARLNGRHFETVSNEDPVWEPVVDALAMLCHNIICTTAPQKFCFGGGVIVKQPHLLPRIENHLINLLEEYIQLPIDGDYLVRSKLGEQVGPLGSIALAIEAQARN